MNYVFNITKDRFTISEASRILEVSPLEIRMLLNTNQLTLVDSDANPTEATQMLETPLISKESILSFLS